MMLPAIGEDFVTLDANMVALMMTQVRPRAADPPRTRHEAMHRRNALQTPTELGTRQRFKDATAAPCVRSAAVLTLCGIALAGFRVGMTMAIGPG